MTRAQTAAITLFGIDRPILMAIVGSGGALSAGRAVGGGADLIQVRARGLPGRDLANLVRAVIAEVGPADRVIVNSRPDIAEMTGARGVHLPESGLDPRSVRRAFPGLAIGVSRHDRSGLERAVGEGADYVILGPVFGTPGKEDGALGLARFREILLGVPLPLLAVGGVTPENAGSLIEQGVVGVAAIRSFADPLTAAVRAESFRSVLDKGNVRRARA